MTYIPYNPYEIFLYDHAGTKLAMLQGWKRLEYIQRVSAPWNSIIYFDMNENDDQVSIIRDILPDYFVIIYRTDPVTLDRDKVFEGVNLTVVDQALKKGSLEFTLYGQGYTTFLKRRVTVPPAGQENDDQNGAAGDVIKAYITNNFITPTDADRTFTGLTNDPTISVGEAVKYSARYINVETIAQTVSEEGGISYGIIGNDPPTAFVFHTRRVWGTDRRIDNTLGNLPMFFNLKFDNLEIPILSLNYSDETNLVYVGGQGSGTDRTILELENTDATAVSPFGRKEAFTDARNESDNAGLLTTAKAYIGENKARKELTFNVRQTVGTRWIRDWNLGDIVTAKYYDFVTEKKITEVKVSVSSGKDADVIELVEAELADLTDTEFAYVATYTSEDNMDPNPFPNGFGYDPGAYLPVGTGDIAVFDDSNYLYVTHTFDTTSGAGGPTWDQTLLSLSGTPLGFVGDAFSPKYIRTGTTVNGWLVTTTNIYYIVDIANVEGQRQVRNQHTFATASNYRTIQTDRGIEGFVVVASYYDGVGTKACCTHNGGNQWIEVLVSSGTGGGAKIVSWTTTHSQFPVAGEQDGSFTLSISDDTLSVAWGRDGAQWDQTGLDVTVSCGVTVSDLTYRVRRLELNPTASTLWDLPGDSYSNTLALLVPNNDDTHTTYTGETDGWAHYHWQPVPATTLTKFRSTGGGWRGNPNPTGSHTTNNLEFEILTINGGPNEAGSAGQRPQVHVSGKIPGLCFVTAFFGSNGALYKSLDYGASWTKVTVPANSFGGYLGGGILFPWNYNMNEKLFYWGNMSTTLATFRTELDGTTTTEITPTGDYGPNEPRCFGTCALDRSYVAFLGTNYATNNISGFYSADAGNTWTTIIAPTARASTYTAIHISDDPNVVYFWGPLGIAYSSDYGTTIDDRRGNMTGMSPTPTEIIGICGV